MWTKRVPCCWRGEKGSPEEQEPDKLRRDKEQQERKAMRNFGLVRCGAPLSVTAAWFCKEVTPRGHTTVDVLWSGDRWVSGDCHQWHANGFTWRTWRTTPGRPTAQWRDMIAIRSLVPVVTRNWVWHPVHIHGGPVMRQSSLVNAHKIRLACKARGKSRVSRPHRFFTEKRARTMRNSVKDGHVGGQITSRITCG